MNKALSSAAGKHSTLGDGAVYISVNVQNYVVYFKSNEASHLRLCYSSFAEGCICTAALLRVTKGVCEPRENACPSLQLPRVCTSGLLRAELRCAVGLWPTQDLHGGGSCLDISSGSILRQSRLCLCMTDFVWELDVFLHCVFTFCFSSTCIRYPEAQELKLKKTFVGFHRDGSCHWSARANPAGALWGSEGYSLLLANNESQT